MIEITKASAGSGKTYTLAKHYISLLLKDRRRDAYRHILAVTFTNKATEEMKSRIIKEINILAKTPTESDYYNDFVPSIMPDADSLSKKAGEILKAILTDYSKFAICTIDKFFQQTLRSFSREIGHLASYQIELDTKSLIKESVDRLLDSLSDDTISDTVVSWLTDNALENADDGNRNSYERELYEYAGSIHSSGFKSAVGKGGFDEDELFDLKKVKDVSKFCRTYIENKRVKVADLAKKVVSEFKASGIPAESISRINDKFVAIENKFSVLTEKDEIPVPGAYVVKLALGPEEWFKKGKERAVPEPLFEAVTSFVEWFDSEEYKAYRTARLLRDQFYGLGLAGTLRKSFEDLLKEKNVLDLEDSNTILKGIIDDTDAPFIYEKVGVRFDRFLLDEFQDTSRIQWENFRPLLRESVSKAGDDIVGGNDLIVGDVKQSIYRWRDSDWNLLHSEVSGDFPGESFVPEPLKVNYRSRGNVIRFNNDFFSIAPEWLDAMGDFNDGRIAKIYEDVEQGISRKKSDGGSVQITFTESDDDEAAAVVESVRKAVDAGYELREIAVLCRKNDDCATVANELIANGINVITTASLKVAASETVSTIISILSLIDNPSDSVGSYVAKKIGMEIPEFGNSLPDLCEDIIRRLTGAGIDTSSEIPYLESFMDMVQEYSGRYGNSLHGFLKYFEDTDRYISQPSDAQAVNILTIHKSKGLEFPYVILPYVEQISLDFHKGATIWASPDVGKTPLEGKTEGVYNVSLGSGLKETHFKDVNAEERKMVLVDGINDAYVAFTRACQSLHIITCKSCNTDDPKNIGDLVHRYLEKDYSNLEFNEDNLFGEIHRFPPEDRKEGKPMPLPVNEYKSYPLGKRLKFSTDSMDFFDEEGNTGAKASRRLRGIVLHDILSKVVVAEDLAAAVEEAVASGALESSEREEAELRLKAGIEAHKEWFPDNRDIVFNEMSIIDSKGDIHRPDRVIDDGENVIIIDYKFGKEFPKYKEQIEGYAELYREMGRKKVETHLWYLDRD